MYVRIIYLSLFFVLLRGDRGIDVVFLEPSRLVLQHRQLEADKLS